MKLFRLAAGLGVALPLAGMPQPGLSAEPLVAHRADRQLSARSLLLPVGTPRAELLKHVGPPDLRLSPDAWVYLHRSTNRPELSAGFDTLVIVFEGDRVATMRIVAETSVRQLAAALENRKPSATLTPLVAAHPPPK
jgi:hypothetical protein